MTASDSLRINQKFAAAHQWIWLLDPHSVEFKNNPLLTRHSLQEPGPIVAANLWITVQVNHYLAEQSANTVDKPLRAAAELVIRNCNSDAGWCLLSLFQNFRH